MDFLVNAVKAYFDRSWSRKDMMSLAPIPQNDSTSLNRVYLTLYWAMMCSSYGSFLHLFWELGDITSLFNCSKCTQASLYIPRESGASISIGSFLYLAMKTGERSIIYLGCLTLACFLMFSSIIVNDLFSSFIDSHTAHLMLKVATMQTLFIGYFVLYSQEILYDARFGNINAVNRTLTIFFHLPAVVIHATRLCLRVKLSEAPHIELY
ncbi:hypothetical protein H5410_012291 [Solanum commersonii]|uniref:Uncharacterized protein n=1 Tax=Solanum commersonii TaxID=4109 RepID=A0A9J6ARZ1_SOLCO|nr:hypothetical protein H5410_012291 [Solanum commersonii]